MLSAAEAGGNGTGTGIGGGGGKDMFILFQGRMTKSMRLGGGGRFRKLMMSFRRRGYNATSARRLSAFIGRRKYGRKRFALLAARGRKRYRLRRRR